MLIYHHDTEDPDLCGGFPFVSPDGLEWTRTSTVLPTQDAECLWQDRSTGRYYAFLKDRMGNNRSRMLCTSDDFDEWSEPQWVITPDHGDHQGTNFYNQTAFTMAGRALGFLNVYDVTTQTSWVELVESGDTLNWRRMPFRCPGGRLRLNFTSSEPVTVAMKRAGYGGEYDGFTQEECEPISGDLQDREIRWKSGKTPADLEGRFVRIKVYGQNAVVYSAAFVE